MFYEIKVNDLVLTEQSAVFITRLKLQPVSRVTKRFFYVGNKCYSKKTGKEHKHMKRKAYPPCYIWENQKLKEKMFPSEIFESNESMASIHYANLKSNKRKPLGKEMINGLNRFLKTLVSDHNYVISTSDVFENITIDRFVEEIKTVLPDAEVFGSLVDASRRHSELYIEFKIIQAPLTAELEKHHLTFVGTSKEMDLLVSDPSNSEKIEIGLNAIESYDKNFNHGHFTQLVKVKPESDLAIIVNDWWQMTDIESLSYYTKTFLEALKNV